MIREVTTFEDASVREFEVWDGDELLHTAITSKVAEPATDVQALAEALAALPPATLDSLRTALGL